MWLLFYVFFAHCEETYTLHKVVDTSNFYDFFHFDTNDYNAGEVTYVTKSEAQSLGMVRFDNNQIYMGAEMNTWGRRKSVKVISNEKFTTGLFVIQLQHMPGGCGTWPAYWLCGPNWPNGGEIDIIEEVNDAKNDVTTLHTSYGCRIGSGDHGTGTVLNSDCYVHDGQNAGCGIRNNDDASFGNSWNNIGGGAVATLWDSAGIQNWFFRAGTIPSDILGRKPMPSTWGQPYAKWNFGGDCSSNHFYDHTMIINLNFCGEWAGATFGNDCPGKGDCASYTHDPSNVKEAYWLIDEIDIYTVGGSGPTPSPATDCCCDASNQCINDDWCNQSKANCEGPCNANHDHHWGPPGGSSSCCLYAGSCIADDYCNASSANCLGPCNANGDKKWGPPTNFHRVFRNGTVIV